jgi:hypothetical protein
LSAYAARVFTGGVADGAVLNIMKGVHRDAALLYNQEFRVARGEHWVLWFETTGDDERVQDAEELLRRGDLAVMS